MGKDILKRVGLKWIWASSHAKVPLTADQGHIEEAHKMTSSIYTIVIRNPDTFQHKKTQLRYILADFVGQPKLLFC